jgi:hypothetical protein
VATSMRSAGSLCKFFDPGTDVHWQREPAAFLHHSQFPNGNYRVARLPSDSAFRMAASAACDRLWTKPSWTHPIKLAERSVMGTSFDDHLLSRAFTRL